MVFIILAGGMVLAALGMRAGIITDKENAKGYRIASVVALIIAGVFFIAGIVDIVGFLGEDSTPDYETVYEDDNGNGEYDPGEWNYTVDEDGNIVDVDE